MPARPEPRGKVSAGDVLPLSCERKRLVQHVRQHCRGDRKRQDSLPARKFVPAPKTSLTLPHAAFRWRVRVDRSVMGRAGGPAACRLPNRRDSVSPDTPPDRH
jgi:hypothetical protein